MNPQQISNRLDAVTTQLYKAIISLEKLSGKIDDLAIQCEEVPEKYLSTDGSSDILKRAHATSNQVSFDLSGVAEAIQELIYRLDETVSELSLI